MHFEPANKEKKRISVKVPLILLAVWMLGSTWYWMCGVKDLCGGGSVLEETLNESSSPSIDK